MRETDLAKRIESLEAQAMHHEASIDELTRTLVAQETRLKSQSESIRRLEDRLTGLAARHVGADTDEPPPPHY